MNLGNTYRDALKRHHEGSLWSRDVDLLAEAARRFVEGEQANTAFHEGYKAGYQAALEGVVIDQQVRQTLFQCTYEELTAEIARRDTLASEYQIWRLKNEAPIGYSDPTWEDVE